jgi:hypothetical protein
MSLTRRAGRGAVSSAPVARMIFSTVVGNEQRKSIALFDMARSRNVGQSTGNTGSAWLSGRGSAPRRGGRVPKMEDFS